MDEGTSTLTSNTLSLLTGYFTKDTNQIVEIYLAGTGTSDGFFSIAIGQLVPGTNFEEVATSSFNTAANRAALEAIFDEIVGGAVASGGKLAVSSDGQYYDIDNDDSNYIAITATPYEFVGRRYGTGSNIGSYQIVIRANTAVRNSGDSGECIVNNNCYSANAPVAASGAEMGVLALINGMMNPGTAPVAVNTHGIAPGATLSVFTTPAATDAIVPFAAPDLVYRARGIDAGYDRDPDDSSKIIADDDRNIVIIQNNIANTNVNGSATVANVNTRTTGDTAYRRIYRALQVGLVKSTSTEEQKQRQDAYVFAARDGAAADVGILAALPISTVGTSIKDYSIIVVAVEDGQTPCGTDLEVQKICIAAPGMYKYRNRDDTDGSEYGTYATTALSTATSANAAASLVAGGLALLESIFPTETTARLIDRLLMTASTNFNYDFDGDNTKSTYAVATHGKGLMDLACAIKPGLSASLSRTGCVNRYADPVTTDAPQQKPEDKPIEPKGSAQGDKGEDDTAKSGGIDYCDIDGLRIILSGDLCSDDHILLVDKDGKVQDIDIGNLRFGMGFGDSLLKGLGITFFDAFDTAWTVDNPYNPYAHLLNFGNIVIAPAQSRFDVEDRFSAMRYGTRPGQRKTWAADTARITMDFATQGMATKPYAVTRGQIRNTITHDNMGADPYANVRFMLSAEDTIGTGLGRLKVMTYSGMAMGYALGLHSQGDAMMPSYLLTNRDSFHAPYLSLSQQWSRRRYDIPFP